MLPTPNAYGILNCREREKQEGKGLERRGTADVALPSTYQGSSDPKCVSGVLLTSPNQASGFVPKGGKGSSAPAH
jgi:hypothetical protein